MSSLKQEMCKSHNFNDKKLKIFVKIGVFTSNVILDFIMSNDKLMKISLTRMNKSGWSGGFWVSLEGSVGLEGSGVGLRCWKNILGVSEGFCWSARFWVCLGKVLDCSQRFWVCLEKVLGSSGRL